ncbi:hypothetical protein SAMN05428938_4511 [Streptomyces sp. KS_5]|nr:hypothetical protein SAMN05216482_3581 [Streptomyces sp. PAN_FS17]SED29728.1 hypothetical protein SAMN05428938_4511 [Streptomyces sp. KS_5]
MTEAFATTVASVSSAILIAGTLEAAAFGRAVQGWTRTAVDNFMNKGVELAAMTPSERQVASRAFKAEWLPKYGLGAAKSLFFLALGLLWGVLMAAQAVAILMCLLWLADPTGPKDVGIARALVGIVAAGAVVVAAVPIVRVMYSPLGPLAEVWLERRLRQAARRVSPPSTDEERAEGLGTGQLPSPREPDEASAGDGPRFPRNH